MFDIIYKKIEKFLYDNPEIYLFFPIIALSLIFSLVVFIYDLFRSWFYLLRDSLIYCLFNRLFTKDAQSQKNNKKNR